MRLTLDARARRFLRRLPHSAVYSGLEIALLALLAFQCARLLWAVATPLGPLGDWRPAAPASRTDSPGILNAFDPFFRLSDAGGGPAEVSALGLTLFGVRQDQASGRGSAIIGLPDGTQQSFAVGEEVMPGATLAAVGFDNVTIARGTAREQIFLDQSTPATVVDGSAAMPAAAMTPAAAGAPQSSVAAVDPNGLVSDMRLTPRRAGGEITGYSVETGRTGEVMRAAGLEAGDVIRSVNGVQINSPERVTELREEFAAGTEAIVEIERGGEVRTLRVQVRK